MKRWLLGMACALAMVAHVHAAAPGLTDKELVLGQSGDYSGSRAQLMKEYMAGARLRFAMVNDHGGIHGRQVRLVTLDDRYDTSTAILNTRKLVNDEKVFALFGYLGTGITNAVATLADELDVPLLMPLAGGDELRAPGLVSRNLFLFRASFADEINHIVAQLRTLSIPSVALVYEDNVAGRNTRALFEKAARQNGRSIAGFGVIPPNSTDVQHAVAELKRVQPPAILLSGVGPAVRAFIKSYSAQGLRPTYYTMSGVSSEALHKQLGPISRGIVISQVVPAPFKAKLPVQVEFAKARAAKGLTGPGLYSEFEGYLAAKVVTEALYDAGRELTRERLRAALERMAKLDLGGLTVSYAPKNHNGSSYVDLVIVSGEGKFVD